MFFSSLKRRIFFFSKWIKMRQNFSFAPHDGKLEQKKKCIYCMDSDFFDYFNYKDESWNYIKHLTDFRKALNNNQIISLEDNPCNRDVKCIYNTGMKRVIVSTERIRNNWVCFCSKSQTPQNFELSFGAKIQNSFTELQLSFNYIDLGNRFRFMLRDNELAVFEVVNKGTFFHKLFKKKLSLQFDTYYFMRFVCIDNVYSWFINDDLILSVKNKASNPVGGVFVLSFTITHLLILLTAKLITLLYMNLIR